MTDKTQVLTRIDNSKLLDIVKNYKQYGYEPAIREQCIHLLKQRGYTENDLQLSGALYNRKYDEAEKEFKNFLANSKKVLILYIVCLLAVIVAFFNKKIGITISVAASIFYLYFLIKTYSNLNNFYDYVDKDKKRDNFSLTSNIPFYIFTFLELKKELETELKEIR